MSAGFQAPIMGADLPPWIRQRACAVLLAVACPTLTPSAEPGAPSAGGKAEEAVPEVTSLLGRPLFALPSGPERQPLELVLAATDSARLLSTTKSSSYPSRSAPCPTEPSIRGRNPATRGSGLMSSLSLRNERLTSTLPGGCFRPGYAVICFTEAPTSWAWSRFSPHVKRSVTSNTSAYSCVLD